MYLYFTKLNQHLKVVIQGLDFIFHLIDVNLKKALKKKISFYKILQRGKTPGEMEMEFLEKASQFDTYGAELIVVKVN